MNIWNENRLTETKNGNTKTQKQRYERWRCKQHYQPTHQPRQWSHPDAAFFSATTVAADAANATASAIDPDAHFLSSGLKLDTELF